MAASLNTVALVGQLLTETDQWETEGGISVAEFTLGLTNQAKAADGEWIQVIQRVPVRVFGRQAEVEWAEGQTVSVEGRLEQAATDELRVVARIVSPVSEPVAEAVA